MSKEAMQFYCQLQTKKVKIFSFLCLSFLSVIFYVRLWIR